MPNHDFRCTACGFLLVDQYRSVTEGAQANPPFCPRCHCQMSWVPAVGKMDLLSDGSGKFVIFDGQNRRVEVDSFSMMHRLEAESAQQYRNHEGQPLRFRALHQHKSNMATNTFGDTPEERPSAVGKAKFGRQGGMRQTAEEPEVVFGPGVNESNTSALKTNDD